MLFTINDLGFSIAGLLLEGWLAFAARCVCALALLFIGWVVSRWMQKSLFPRLRKRSWPILFPLWQRRVGLRSVCLAESSP